MKTSEILKLARQRIVERKSWYVCWAIYGQGSRFVAQQKAVDLFREMFSGAPFWDEGPQNSSLTYFAGHALTPDQQPLHQARLDALTLATMSAEREENESS